jgi:iron-sulfur cluster assembly accessory protein
MRLRTGKICFRRSWQLGKGDSIPARAARPSFRSTRHQMATWFDLPQGRDSLVRSMITVTDNAVRQLRVLLEAQAPNVRKGLRVQIAKGGCSGLQYEMSLDGQKAGDSIVEKEGVEFLVDSESADYLRGATLDYRDGLTGTGFHIENPNAARTCGCGTSFEAAPPA